MHVTETHRSDRKLNRNTRSGRPNWKDYDKAPRVYVQPKGESILENLENRRTRPYNEYRKVVADKALAELGLSSDTHTLSWSQYAGCSCPCSPGFIVKAKKGTRFTHALPKADVWVTVEAEPADDVSVESTELSPQEALIARMERAGAL